VSSAHPKPSKRSIYLGLPMIRGMVKDRHGTDVHKERWSPGDGRLAKQVNVAESSLKKALVQEEAKGWVMEVLKGADAGHVEVPDDDDDGMWEFDLEEEDTAATSKVMAIAFFFLRKSYSMKYLFYDMLKVTGAGSRKKQETPVKACMKEALKAMVDVEVVDVTINKETADPMELMKEAQALMTETLEADPNHLTGTHGESHQEQ
jgi:hypothetical protein